MADSRMPALRSIALVILASWGPAAGAAGLGQARVQSALGQPLHVTIPILGEHGGEITANCIGVRLESADGVALVSSASGFSRSIDGNAIHVSTRQSINEPAVALRVSVSCLTPIERTYQLLLDPVIMLPQLAQRDPVVVSNAQRAIGSRVDALTASEAGSRAIDTGRKRASRRKARIDSEVPTYAQVEGTGRSAPLAAGLPPKTVVRNVLKLAGDDTLAAESTFSPGLKLTDTLSESRDTGDPQKAAELRAAYNRFQAALRDEDLVQKSEAQVGAMRAKMEEMEKENALLKRQSLEEKQAADELRKVWFSPTVVSWLILLLTACAGAIGWLVWRLKESRRAPTSFWEETVQESVTDASTISANWDDTELTNAEFSPDSTIMPASKPPKRKAPADAGGEEASDWEKGVPMDDSLALEWADRETTIQPDSFDDGDDFGETNAGAPVDQAPAPMPVKPEIPKSPAVAPAVHQVKTPVPQRESSAPSEDRELEVDEISDLMQEAEFWMLLNDASRAITVLEPYALVRHPMSPVPWIYLLDLYRVVGDSAKYEALKSRAIRLFNTRLPPWKEPADDVQAHTLADYPHVVQAIQDLWEGDYIVPYLESLLFDDRQGDRSGFDLAVYREIIHLIRVAREPDIDKRRAQLSFGKSQPRLISQNVTTSAPASKPVATGSPSLLEAAEIEIPGAGGAQAAPARTGPAALPVSEVPVAVAKKTASVNTPAAASLQSESAAHAAGVVEPATENAAEDDDIQSDMARKLDLAVAYQEIGENVGARVLLEEVIQGGTTLQVEKAKRMLKKLLKEIDWQ